MTEQTIDITPTWLAILPTLVTPFIDRANHEQRRIAMNELRRMARLADLYVASKKDVCEACAKAKCVDCTMQDEIVKAWRGEK